MTWTRVKDSVTGHEYSTAAVVDGQEVLGKPATDRFGNPLAAKPNRPLRSLGVAGLTVAQLRTYAQQHAIDLGEASKKDDILTVIAAHEQGDDITTPAV